MKKHPLPRKFYLLGIFILMLYWATSAFQSYLFSQTSGRTYGLPSFSNWFVVFVLLQLAASLVMLRYYHYREYWLAFWVGVFVILAARCQDFIIYNIISVGKLNEYYFPSTLVVLGANALLGACLLVSKAGERPFLKAAGALSALLGSLFLLTSIWSLNTQDAHLKVTLEQVYRWAAWANLLTPLLYSLNFCNEFRHFREKPDNTFLRVSPLWTAFNTFLAGVALSGLFFSVRVCQQIAEEIREEIQPALVSEMEKARAERFEAHTYVNTNGDTLPYRLMKPLKYDPQKKYPLVVCLHHRGAHGKDNIRQIEGSDAPFLSHYLNREKYPAFLFVPQCPQELDWQSPVIDALVLETIQALERAFSIDGSRRYVMGTSGGGFGSWYFIGNHPNVFAAAIPRCGGGDPDLGTNMVKVAVWAFHGQNDQVAPVSGSRNMIEAIRKAGGTPRYTEFAGVGHGIDKEFQSTPGVLDWLFAQKRQ